MDHIINLPTDFQYLHAFLPIQTAPNVSAGRDISASIAMAAEINEPGRYIATQLEAEMFVEIGMSSTIGIMPRLSSLNIAAIDMAPLVDQAHNGNPDALRLEMAAQNKQQVAQLLTVADASQLFVAIPNPAVASDPSQPTWIHGAPLLPTLPPGTAHTLLRIGHSDSDGYGLYLDPLAPQYCTDPATGAVKLVPILWTDIIAANITTCIAIMPANVLTVPPTDFSYQNGTWPTTPPTINIDDALQAMMALKAANDNEQQQLAQQQQQYAAEQQRLADERAARDAFFTQIIRDLGGVV